MDLVWRDSLCPLYIFRILLLMLFKNATCLIEMEAQPVYLLAFPGNSIE